MTSYPVWLQQTRSAWMSAENLPCWFYVIQWLNYSTLCWPHPFYAILCNIKLHFCRRPVASRGVMSDEFVGPIVSDKCVKFCDPRLNRSGEIKPKADGCDIFGRFSNFDYCRSEVASDVISSMFVRPIVPNKCVKLCDPLEMPPATRSRFSGYSTSWFLWRTNEWTNMTEAT